MTTLSFRLVPLVAGMAVAIAACGSASSAPLVAPPTVPTTMPTSATVPPLGFTPSVLPATAVNATANAQGACSRFSLLYIRLPQMTVSTSTAQQLLAPVQRFAAAAATGDPTQWGQLRADVDALVDYVATGAWQGTTQQINLAPVRTVELDCRPLT